MREPAASPDVEPEEKSPRVDDLVDHLLRDQDFLLAREIRRKVDELNQLFVQAQRQKLRIETEATRFDAQGAEKVTYLEVRVFKQI